MKKLSYSILLGSILLFLWSGATEMLPWGITSAQNISVRTTQPAEGLPVTNLVQLPPNSLTTEQFDRQFVNKISTYTTNKTFSWIVTQPLNENYTGYFVKEFITQLVVAIFLSILLLLTIQLALKTRIAIIIIASLLAVSATYGQLINWWSLPTAYALGVSLNLVVGWTLTSLILANFVIKGKKEPK